MANHLLAITTAPAAIQLTSLKMANWQHLDAKRMRKNMCKNGLLNNVGNNNNNIQQFAAGKTATGSV